MQPADLEKVKRVAIYPTLGIARVGNSPNEYFLGSTVPGQPASDPDDFRDKKGRIKRQAAKFFVFGLDAKGNILGELDERHGVKIDWRVEVANKKAAWYRFDLALDIPAAEGEYDTDGNATPGGLPLLSQKRNRDYVGKERRLLTIDGGEQRISGRNKNAHGKTHHFEGAIGKERQPVYLGEVRTDGRGRLIFLGGYGKSASFDPAHKELTTFANNEGWHDDTSDGPVDATVTLPDGRKLEAAGAWVLTAPTNFAVGVQAFSTGYDLLLDVARSGKAPSWPSFFTDIYPTLEHLSINQWVNAGVLREMGWGSAYDFDDAALVERLQDRSESNRPFRQAVFGSFRNPDYAKLEPLSWPPLYGDAVTFNINSTDPRNWFAVTRRQYTSLERWARGRFVVDEPRPSAWEEMTPEEQAHGLTEAALEETLGGPFHPGCEFTWPMRHRMMYDRRDPFRIKRRRKAKEDFGVAIDSAIALAKGGPLDGSSPGDITKWMAVPWQTDTSSCLSAYRAYAGEYLPTFWPARVPNDVLTEQTYRRIKSRKASNEEKIEAFGPSSRKKWLRGYIFDDDGNFLFGTSIEDRVKGITKFTEEWAKIGIILNKPLDANPDLFPRRVWVETGRQIAAARGKSAEGSGKRPEWVKMNPRYLR